MRYPNFLRNFSAARSDRLPNQRRHHGLPVAEDMGNPPLIADGNVFHYYPKLRRIGICAASPEWWIWPDDGPSHRAWLSAWRPPSSIAGPTRTASFTDPGLVSRLAGSVSLAWPTAGNPSSTKTR